MSVRQRVLTWLALASLHALVVLYGWVIGGDRIAAIVAGTIYLPLLPLGKIGLPVVRANAWFFPPPTGLGWLCVVVFWLIVYWGVAALIAAVVARRRLSIAARSTGTR
jgi:hypothetical protein